MTVKQLFSGIIKYPTEKDFVDVPHDFTFQENSSRYSFEPVNHVSVLEAIEDAGRVHRADASEKPAASRKAE